jgi:hypothetical protein
MVIRQRVLYTLLKTSQNLKNTEEALGGVGSILQGCRGSFVKVVGNLDRCKYETKPGSISCVLFHRGIMQ